MLAITVNSYIWPFISSFIQHIFFQLSLNAKKYLRLMLCYSPFQQCVMNFHHVIPLLESFWFNGLSFPLVCLVNSYLTSSHYCTNPDLQTLLLTSELLTAPFLTPSSHPDSIHDFTSCK